MHFIKLQSVMKFLCALIMIFSIRASAQSDTDEIQPNYIPPSPATASLGSFGNIPVGLNTGRPNINLEIYNLKDGSVSVPISISYSSNGVAVDAVSSLLGLEWSLISSGVVSRQINGFDDLRTQFFSPDPETGDFCAPRSPLAIATKGSNTEKDIYSYSAFGISGKFIFDGDNIREIRPSKNKIELLYATGENGSVLKYFKITDTNGTEFYFGDADTAIETSNNKNLCGNSIQTSGQTGWYLTKIKKIDGTVASFKYSIKSYSFNQAYSQMARSQGDVVLSPASVSVPCVSSVVNHSVPFLEEIRINDKRIVFEYEKLDLTIRDSDQLTKMTVYKNETEVFKSFDFSYYLLSRNTSSDVLNSYTTSSGVNNKLIFLKEIKEYTSDHSAFIPKYSFEYYSPEQLPPRFSFSKDIYGYYNAARNSNFVYNNIGPLDPLLYQPFSSVKSNRDANKNTVFYGMLKSIAYPTKGKTEIVYEPNSVEVEKRIYPQAIPISANHQAEAGDRNKVVKESDPIQIKFNQTAVLNGWAEENLIEGDPCTLVPVKGASCNVELINALTGEVVKSVTADPSFSMDVSLIGGVTYKIKITTMVACMNAEGRLSYYDEPIRTVRVQEPVAGVRVKRTVDHDDNGHEVIKEYYYHELDCETCGTGYFATSNPAGVNNVDLKVSGSNAQYTMHSSPKQPLSSFDGIVVSYGKVIESEGVNYANGGILHVFDNNMDEQPAPVCYEYLRGASFSNGFSNGEISTLKFKKEGSRTVPLMFEEMDYGHNPSLDVAFNNFYGGVAGSLTAVGSGGVGGGAGPGITTEPFFDFNVYQTRIEWHYLAQKKTTVFDLNGTNGITTVVDYAYDNPTHLQLTSQSTANSKGEKTKTKFFYALDPEMSGKPFINELIAKNIVGVPLDILTFNGNDKTSEKLNVYELSAETGNLLVPKYVYTNKGVNPIDVSHDLKITFNKYDDKGNVLQYTLEGGMPVCIIWGYNRTQPIAKIENASYGQIASFVANLQNLSDADNDNCLTSSCKEQILRESLNAMRSSLNQFMITTYTYNPLQGITSITDPKGMSTYYEYDSFNRLKFVKNKDLNVLEKYCYNYKGQMIDCGDNSSSSVIIYKSAALSGPFTKNNCAAGGAGSSVVFNQPEGAITSEITQADADSRGLAKFNTEGQIYANTNPNVKCTFSSNAYSGSFTKNNCAAGGVGESVVYSQAAGAITSEISQADADSKGLDRFNQDGLAYANANAKCTFSSKAYSDSFTKNNCAAGGVGSSVAFSQAIGAVTSETSQADADSRGLTKFNTDGQAYANANAKCTFSSKAYSGSFTRNNCAAGGVGSSVTFSQAIGAVISETSQADADSRGLAKFNADGQAYANANAKCIFSSKAYSGSFTRNSCAAGGVGSSATFTQAIGAVTSETSQADADSRGLAKFNADGQAYANANAKCTFSSKAYSSSFTRNSCASGGVPSSVAFSQAIGAVTSETSQADADSRGLDKFNTDGQAYANANAKCTFSSKAYSGSFTRNNCAAEGVPSTVVFSQALGAVTSESSQADADSRGLDKFNTDGQAYANANAKCTFSSKAYNGSFTRNNCAGGEASSVAFSQGIGAVLSEVSQADADSRGLAKFNTDGQANANANGTCLYYSAAKSGSFTRNNCSVGYQPGAPVVYTVAARAYNSSSSQADADNKAQNAVNSNGQNYANANGSCTPIVFNAEGEQNFDINRLTITLTASSANHNGYTFNIEINYDNPVNVNKYKTITATLLPGETYKVVSTSVLARTYAIIAF